MQNKIQLFQERHVRSVWDEETEEWYFSVQDVVEILTDSKDVKQYIKRMLSRDEQLKNNWGTICTPVEIDVAKRGGDIAKEARLKLEEETGNKVVSPLNAKSIYSLKSDNKQDDPEDINPQ